MRDRSKTIASLRRMIERPGTPEEGQTARRLLEMMGGENWIPRPFDPAEWPFGTRLFYCYWCYDNDIGTVRTKPPKFVQGQWWMLIKFDRLKQARWVPVTSDLGCHIAKQPFWGDEAETLYRGEIEWKEIDRKFGEKLDSLGIPHKVTEFRMTGDKTKDSSRMSIGE